MSSPEILDGADAAEVLDVAQVRKFTRNHVEGVDSWERTGEESPEEKRQIQEYRKELRHRVLRSIVDIAKQGTLSVIRIDGEVAGMAGYEHAGHMPDGRDVYELMRLSVLPKFADKKLSSRLFAHVFQKVRHEHPSGLVLVHTKDPRVKGLATKHACAPLQYLDFIRIKDPENDVTDELLEWVNKEEEKGWAAYLFDPGV